VATHTETRSTEREREATESSAPDGAQTEKTIEPAIALPPVAVRLSLCPSARSLLRRSSASFALLSLLPSFSFCLCLSLLQRSLRLSRSSLRRPCSLRQPWAPYKVRLLHAHLVVLLLALRGPVGCLRGLRALPCSRAPLPSPRGAPTAHRSAFSASRPLSHARLQRPLALRFSCALLHILLRSWRLASHARLSSNGACSPPLALSPRAYAIAVRAGRLLLFRAYPPRCLYTRSLRYHALPANLSAMALPSHTLCASSSNTLRS